MLQFLLTFRLYLKKPIEFEIQTTHEVENLTCQVIGTKGVISTEIITSAANKTFKYSLKPKKSMMPKSFAIFHYITNGGEIISDRIKLEFDNELNNQVSYNLKHEVIEPS